MKILILVLSCNNNGFSIMDDCIKSTWGSVKTPFTEIFFYYHKLLDNGTECFNNNIFINGLESYANIGHKTIKAFEYLLQNQEFDFILRTNSSSFIHLYNLINFLKDKPKDKFYAGYPIPYHTEDLNIDFATGSGYIISRDLVKYIVENQNKWNHNYPDDVGVGKLLCDYKIDFIRTDWIKFTEPPTSKDILKNIGNNFHLRCKIETEYNPSKQCQIMQNLYNIIYENYNF